MMDDLTIKYLENGESLLRFKPYFCSVRILWDKIEIKIILNFVVYKLYEDYLFDIDLFGSQYEDLILKELPGKLKETIFEWRGISIDKFSIEPVIREHQIMAVIRELAPYSSTLRFKKIKGAP